MLAGGAELVLLRTLTRTAIHIPGISALAAPYAVLAGLGRFAYYVAALLLILLLCALVWELVRRRTAASVIAASALTLFLVAAALARAGPISSGALDLASAVAVAGVAVTGILAPPAAGGARRGSLAVFSGAFLLSGYGATADGSASALVVAEILALVWCASALLLVPRRADRAAVTSAIAVAVVTYAALVAGEATAKILLLWNLGLAGYLPAWTYAIAFGALAYGLVAALRSSRPLLAAALILLVLGGIGLHSTYQTGFVLAGLAMLSFERDDGGPAGRDETRAGIPAGPTA